MRLSRTTTMTADAKLQVLDPVVRLVAVLVMDGFVVVKGTAQVLAHDVAVLELPGALSEFIGGLNAHVAIPLIHVTTTLPVRMSRASPPPHRLRSTIGADPRAVEATPGLAEAGPENEHAPASRADPLFGPAAVVFFRSEGVPPPLPGLIPGPPLA